MKREGWQQHGAVRLSRAKLLRIADRQATAAANFTGGAYSRSKRPRCAAHDHQVSKSRDKGKGAHKLRACDVSLNHRLVSWRVVDDGAGSSTGVLDYKGASASAVLAYLAGGNSWHEEDQDETGNLDTTPPAKAGLSDLYDLIVGPPPNYMPAVVDTDAIEEKDQDTDEEDDDMGFFMVGITIALEFSDGEEEDWIVVEEI